MDLCERSGGGDTTPVTPVATFLVNGNYTFVVPEDNYYTFQLCGGGAGGNEGKSNDSASGGAGAGAVEISCFLLAGQSYDIVVGKGGASGIGYNTAGESGTASSISLQGKTFITASGAGFSSPVNGGTNKGITTSPSAQYRKDLPSCKVPLGGILSYITESGEGIISGASDYMGSAGGNGGVLLTQSGFPTRSGGGWRQGTQAGEDGINGGGGGAGCGSSSQKGGDGGDGAVVIFI